MGDFTNGTILILLGFAIIGLVYIFGIEPFSGIGIVLIVVVAILWAAGAAFLSRGKQKWWGR